MALRQKNGYEFLAAPAAGWKKRNKVRARIMANAITEVATTCDNILIMGHRFADLDCLGAAIGMYAGLSTLGKPCSIVLDTERAWRSRCTAICCSRINATRTPLFLRRRGWIWWAAIPCWW